MGEVTEQQVDSRMKEKAFLALRDCLVVVLSEVRDQSKTDGSQWSG